MREVQAIQTDLLFAPRSFDCDGKINDMYTITLVIFSFPLIRNRDIFSKLYRKFLETYFFSFNIHGL